MIPLFHFIYKKLSVGGSKAVFYMPKPFHVIATPDENGYTITIPENPNVTTHCVDAADIIPTATAAKEQDEQNRHGQTAVCPKCGKTYTGVIRQRHGQTKNGNLP